MSPLSGLSASLCAPANLTRSFGGRVCSSGFVSQRLGHQGETPQHWMRDAIRAPIIFEMMGNVTVTYSTPLSRIHRNILSIRSNWQHDLTCCRYEDEGHLARTFSICPRSFPKTIPTPVRLSLPISSLQPVLFQSHFVRNGEGSRSDPAFRSSNWPS